MKILLSVVQRLFFTLAGDGAMPVAVGKKTPVAGCKKTRPGLPRSPLPAASFLPPPPPQKSATRRVG